jgi:hypothetical protein
MPLYRLALVPALALLTGAAAPEPTLQQVFECQAEVGPSMKLLETLTRTSDEVSGDAPARNIDRLYAAPPSLSIFGFKPFALASSFTTTAEGDQEVMILAAVSAPYKQVEAAMLKARGLKACPMRSGGAKTDCLITFSYGSEEVELILGVRDEGEFVSVTCGHGYKD